MKQYIVALARGGLPECPEISYTDYELIESTSAGDAEAIYNKRHSCTYFYGKAIAEVLDGVPQFLVWYGNVDLQAMRTVL